MRRPLQIVGRFESALSIPLVNRELAKAAVRSNKFASVSLYSSDHIGIYGERARWGLYRGLPKNVHVGLTSEPNVIGHAFGHPTTFHAWLAGCSVKVAGLLTEQDFVPPDLIAVANSMDALWAPSHYVAVVYKQQGVRYPIKVFPHGVGDEFTPDPTVKRNSKFTFLTISGIYHERKGIYELLEAWRLVQPLDADLLLVTTPTPKLEAALNGLENVRVYSPTEALGPEKIAHLLRKVHCYLAPSKGEGYGLVPCEARAVGTPTALTSTTGHREHFRPGIDIEIPSSELEWVPSDFEDLRVSYKGRVPGVSVEGLVAALRSAITDWDTHRERVATVREPTWSERLAPWTKWVAGQQSRTNVRFL